MLHAGDLDGDIFFACWDPDLIPHQHQMCEPLPYTGAAEKPQGSIGREDMIEYFANHSQSILGALNRCFEQWANLKGVKCMECVQLALLFSLGVDSVKSGTHLHLAWPPLYVCLDCVVLLHACAHL